MLIISWKNAKKLGKNLGKAEVERFSDGESDVRINVNVRGKDVFIIQSTCSPANENLMELSIMIDALREHLLQNYYDSLFWLCQTGSKS